MFQYTSDMSKPQVAIISFPGTNNEVESVRTINRAGMQAHCFKWNDDPARLREMDAYFLVGGFSYEDRGRSGMIAARDPVLQVLKEESEKGKVIIGHCNGAQILVESGLIPLSSGLKMSLAHNAVQENNHWKSPGFINEWIWIKPACKRDRCATADFQGPMHVPMAHGEGRFTTIDANLFAELEQNDQIAFQYCTESGEIREDEQTVPNGSTRAIAGICNPAGNVIALMPHPERTTNGDPYFASLCNWLKAKHTPPEVHAVADEKVEKPKTRTIKSTEIFIDTIIVNNEERTIEQAFQRIVPSMRLKQYRYLAPAKKSVTDVLSNISTFNPNKEIAYVREGGNIFRYDAKRKTLMPESKPLFAGISVLRRNVPDTGAEALGQGSETGICYDCSGINEQKMYSSKVMEICGNPNASILEIMPS